MSNKVKNLLGTVTECVESLDESTSLLQNDTGVTQNNSFASGDHKLLSSSTVSTSNEDNESSQGLSSCITEDVGKAHSQNEESKLSLTSILDLITSRGRKNKPSMSFYVAVCSPTLKVYWQLRE
ncbi:hypothetical protein AB6A40_005370 [Gnathostoma spinigerum]|uniref:Uncharacterized protein n=1 Tax=Gnathostoma spinigerum TaxID=75299 RepID=A0ABD6EHG5_9BILA